MWRFAVLVLRDPTLVLTSPNMRKLQLANRHKFVDADKDGHVLHRVHPLSVHDYSRPAVWVEFRNETPHCLSHARHSSPNIPRHAIARRGSMFAMTPAQCEV